MHLVLKVVINNQCLASEDGSRSGGASDWYSTTRLTALLTSYLWLYDDIFVMLVSALKLF